MFVFQILNYSFLNKKNLKRNTVEVKQQQQQKFNKLIRYIASHSKYYQDIIKKQKINIENCTPEDFPVLTKKDVIENFDQIVTDPTITVSRIKKFLEASHNTNDLYNNKYYVIHTSGSSGETGYYVYSQKELARGLANASRIAGIRLFQKLAYIAAIKGHFAGITMANAAHNLPIIYKQLNSFDINEPFQTIIDALEKVQPTSLSGYAFALRKLAEAQEAGKLHIHPQIIQSGGEILNPNDKDYIEKIFKTKMVNVYAASEHLIMGLGKDEYEGMYLMEDDLIFELEANYTCVTNLYNYTLPLIRYQMTDKLTPIADKTNQMPFTKVANIVGRKEYEPIFINEHGEEDFLNSHTIGTFHVKNINKYQMQVHDKKSFTFKVCLEPNLTAKETKDTLKNVEKEIQSILKEKQMSNVVYKVEQVDRLWSDPKTGKFRQIIKD